LDDGSVLAHTESLPNPASTLPPEAATVLDRVSTIRRFARTGEDMGTVGVFEVGSVNFYFPTVPNVIPHGRDIYVGDGQIPEIRIYNVDGSLRRIVRWQTDAAPR
jgi:hypothetical protein